MDSYWVIMHYAVPFSCLRLLLQIAPQDVATCQGTLAVELAALLSADMPPHLAKLVQRWLQQTLSALPWLRWHTPLSRQLSEAWEAGEHGPHGAKQHSTPAAAVLRQVVKHMLVSCAWMPLNVCQGSVSGTAWHAHHSRVVQRTNAAALHLLITG